MSDESSSLPDLMVGSHGDYHWLTTTLHTIDHLLTHCPELVLGRYIAVTSCDSGPLELCDAERSVGWKRRNQIAYSPLITSLDLLPTHGLYDEWYVFETQKNLGILSQGNIFEAPLSAGHVETFVNYGSFVFEPSMREIEALFWRQLEWIRPYAYISEMDYQWLTVVTGDQTEFDLIGQQLRSSNN